MSRIRGEDGRLIRPGRPVPADGSGPPTAQVILPAVDDGEGVEFGVRTVSAGFAINLDAGAIVDAMSRALLAHTREALMTGQRPDGGGEQKPLGKRALSDPDRDSPHRGFNTGELADGLRRTAIRSDGATASCMVYPPASRNAYVGKEAARGVVLLTGTGAAGEAAAAAARAAIYSMVQGLELDFSPAALDAKAATP